MLFDNYNYFNFMSVTMPRGRGARRRGNLRQQVAYMRNVNSQHRARHRLPSQPIPPDRVAIHQAATQSQDPYMYPPAQPQHMFNFHQPQTVTTNSTTLPNIPQHFLHQQPFFLSVNPTSDALHMQLLCSFLFPCNNRSFNIPWNPGQP